MRDPSRSPTEHHQPATFRSRGITAPFTTPLLAGTRVRQGDKMQIEVMVTNPSGNGGIFVVTCDGLRTLCSPTIHDTVLLKAITKAPHFDPAGIRRAGQDIALGGFAGQAAAAAAQAARNADRAEALQARFQLLAGVLEQADPQHSRTRSLADRAQCERLALGTLQRLAGILGCPVRQMEEALEAMAAAAGPVGVTAQDRPARLPRLIERLEETWVSLLQWLRAHADIDIGGLGQTMAEVLQAVAETGSAALAATRATLADPAGMLKRWIKNPVDGLNRLGRCDLLLDGWERVCLLWLTAHSTASRCAALLEMAQVLPVLPTEVGNWSDVPIPRQILNPACRVISQNDCWRSGSAAQTLIQRNEALRGMSL